MTDTHIAEELEARIASAPAALQDVGRGIRDLVRDAAPGAIEKLNPWHIPTFEYHGDMCYMDFCEVSPRVAYRVMKHGVKGRIARLRQYVRG